MPKYDIQYTAINKYDSVIKEAYFQLNIFPEKLEEPSKNMIKVSMPSTVSFSKHPFGGYQPIIHVLSAFSELSVEFNCRVEIDKFNPFDFEMLLPEAEHEVIAHSKEYKVESGFFKFLCKYSSISSEDLELFKRWDIRENLLNYVLGLMEKIKSEFEFEVGFTDSKTLAKDLFKIKKGVCQDFAHLALGVLRHQKIGARYVGGYLSQGGDFKGNSQLHAWIEVNIPNYGWMGFDPSNNLVVDHHYIKVCHGVNYEDCMPIKGVLFSSEVTQMTNYFVKVTEQQ